VLFLRRSNVFEPGVERGVARLTRPGLEVYCCWSEGVIFDTRAVGRAPRFVSADTHSFSVQLEGEILVRRDERETTVATNATIAEPNGPWDERWLGRRFFTLVVEWDPRYGGPVDRQIGSLSPADIDRCRTLANRLRTEGDAPDLVTEVVALISTLRAAGLPLHPVSSTALTRDVPPRAREVAATFGAVLSNIHRGPAWIDLESSLGVDDRTVRRLLDRDPEWYPLGLGRVGFRRALRRERLNLAAAFLTAREATIERVARACGYGSARALLLALHQERRPPPAEVRALVTQR
jgi:AraC-like DNA-binding protein